VCTPTDTKRNNRTATEERYFLCSPSRDVISRTVRCYNRWGSVVVSCCCEKLVAEFRGQFGNPEEGERPLLEVATKQRLVKTVTH
jgi:hypothetical protein